MLKNEFNINYNSISVLMIIPTIINIWDMMDLIFRKSYNDVILSSIYDEDNKCFIFKNINQFFQGIESIQLHDPDDGNVNVVEWIYT